VVKRGQSPDKVDKRQGVPLEPQTPKEANSAADSGTGELASIAAKVIMKVFYAARVARFDLLRAIGHLACHITRWDLDCDKRLHRLMCYVHSTLDHRLVGWTDGDLSTSELHLYADADFAGDQRAGKSTSGVFLAIEGPYTKMPISALSKKQSCVSHSTPEAEIVAGAIAMRQEGLPGQIFFDSMVEVGGVDYGRVKGSGGFSGPSVVPSDTEVLQFHGDNSAMIQVCRSGRNPTMRHLGRTHGISIRWLHDEISKQTCSLDYIPTEYMAADIFTKFFPDLKRHTWDKVRQLINVLSPGEVEDLVGTPGAGWGVRKHQEKCMATISGRKATAARSGRG